MKIKMKIKSHAIVASALGTVAPARYLSLARHRLLLLSFTLTMKIKSQEQPGTHPPSIKMKIKIKRLGVSVPPCSSTIKSQEQSATPLSLLPHNHFLLLRHFSLKNRFEKVEDHWELIKLYS